MLRVIPVYALAPVVLVHTDPPGSKDEKERKLKCERDSIVEMTTCYQIIIEVLGAHHLHKPHIWKV